MSITAAELIPYLSANMPETETGTSGGAIDLTGTPSFTQLSANDTVHYVSSAAGDTTQTVTITGRDATGTIVSEVKTLTGTTPVSGTQTFERILKVVLSATCAGVVTITKATGGATLVTLAIGQTKAHCLFYAAISSGAIKTYYEKFFWKNTDATLTLQNSTVTMTVDASGDLLQGIAATVGDVATTPRQTAPAGITFVGLNTAQNVPGGGGLAAGSAIGVWQELNLPANAAAIRESFTSQLSGGTV